MSDEFRKPTGDKLDYVFDWTDWLTRVSDSIASSSFTAVPATNINITGPPAPIRTPMTTTVWISGGTIGMTYKIHNTITTAAGRVRTRRIILRINEESL